MRNGKWNFDSAIEEVGRRSGKYSENSNNIFIGQLFTDKIITDSQHDEISGAGLFNSEEDMNRAGEILFDTSSICFCANSLLQFASKQKQILCDQEPPTRPPL